MMERQVGDKDFPLWLIGDSNPVRWEPILRTPLDARHPIRHNIWTALLDVIQDRVYRSAAVRLDTSCIYIRNAVDRAIKKPAPGDTQWGPAVEDEVSGLRMLIEENKPALLFCFGAFAFEFVRRAICEENRREYDHWGAEALGIEFRRRIGKFDPTMINIIPLLHRSISGGKFIESHEYFCGWKGANYFDEVGFAVADKMLEYRDQLRIWIS